MKRFVKHALVAIGALCFAILLVFAVLIGSLWWSLTHDFIDQSNGPQTRTQALGRCGVPLPPSARQVEYATLAAGLQEADIWVRFEASVPDCYSAAQTVFAEWSANFHHSAPKFSPVSYPMHEGSTRLRTDWFDVDHIVKGVAAGSEESWEPRIWIDEERGVFYYHLAH